MKKAAIKSSRHTKVFAKKTPSKTQVKATRAKTVKAAATKAVVGKKRL